MASSPFSFEDLDVPSGISSTGVAAPDSGQSQGESVPDVTSMGSPSPSVTGGVIGSDDIDGNNLYSDVGALSIKVSSAGNGLFVIGVVRKN